MKIYLVTYLSDPADDLSFAESYAFADKQKAVEFINIEYENTLVEHDIDLEDEETIKCIKEFEIKLQEFNEKANEASIYHFGSIYSWKLFEEEV